MQLWSSRKRFCLAHLWLLILLVGVFLASSAAAAPNAGVRNPEIVSIGSGGVAADAASFHASLSENGRFVTFESWATNWAPDQQGGTNWVDIFVRDRWTDTTRKITYGDGGVSTDEDSFIPILTADGRYVVYISYATNLVANDNNGDEWLRQGLDVFLYDMQTGTTQRVSVTDAGGEIHGNSTGTITADGQYVLFVSDGDNVIAGDANGQRRSALYLRDWRTGEMQRLTHNLDGGFPNAMPEFVNSNFDGSVIAFSSDATDLVAGDTNGQTDVFMYERATDSLRLISLDPSGGQANGRSSQPEVSSDGRFITFRSEATNLVPGDTNEQPDIFVYDAVTEQIHLVSKTWEGRIANGLSMDVSICENGRFISFTSEADNLVPGDDNDERDIFLYDMARDELTLVSRNADGVLGNGRAHRSILSADCRYIAYATDADNVVSGDTNGFRDIFQAEIVTPPDLSQSSLRWTTFVQSDEQITYTFRVRNQGMEPAAATLYSPIPAQTTYVPGSATNGASYNESGNLVEWSYTVNGESEVSFSYTVTLDPDVTEFALITNQSTLTGDGNSYTLTGLTAVNGLQTYLPIAFKK